MDIFDLVSDIKKDAMKEKEMREKEKERLREKERMKERKRAKEREKARLKQKGTDRDIIPELERGNEDEVFWFGTVVRGDSCWSFNTRAPECCV